MCPLGLVSLLRAAISSRPWTPNPTSLTSAKRIPAGCAARSTPGSRSGARATTPPSRPARSSERYARSSSATRPRNSGTQSPNASTTRERAARPSSDPGLAKLLRRVEEGDVLRVIVYRVDRLTRKLTDLARLAEFLERHHVGLTIVSGNIDADAGSLAGLQVNLLATFAEWEREIIRERIADQRGAIKARGQRSAGRVPFGYRTDRLTKQLMIDETAAVTVRWFFEEASKGTSTSDLVAKANRKKLAGKQWTSRTALRRLTNPTYAGRRPDGEPGMHAPIVAPELFERVQMLVQGRRMRTPTKRSERGTDEQTAIEQLDPFRLRGLLTCGACGKVMSPAMSEALTSKLAMRLQRKPNAVPRYYRCRTNGCAGQLPALEAEDMVREALDHAPASWSAEDKAKLATYATAFDVMSPVNQRRVFAACCTAVVWDRKRDGLEITLVPHSVLAEDDDEPGGASPRDR
jgi:DNA invertase Pin-like site-specific DNA recombinase